MTDQDAEPSEAFHRDRREHGGAPAHPDDDRLARLTEEERVETGLDAFDPDEVPPAEDGEPVTDVTHTDVYEEERAEIRHELDHDELAVEGEEKRSFPPTRYDRS
jgi:hypothetical protein